MVSLPLSYPLQCALAAVANMPAASVALNAGRYSGEPIPAHKKLLEVQPWHFDVWLELFEETLRDTAPTTEAVAYFMDHAGQIAKGLQIAMFGASGLGRSGA